MISLFLDTSSSYLYSAIIKDETVLQEVKKNYGQDLSKKAVVEIIHMFENASMNPDDIDKILVVTGPGSFTGIRVGVTIAKTFAWARKKKIIPVSSLRAMSLSYTGDKKYVMPLIDARRGYVYGSLYSKKGDTVIEDQYILLSDLEDLAKDYDYEVISNHDIKTQKKKVPYFPQFINIIKDYQNMKSCNPHLVNPRYLKKTEAEEKVGL